MLMRLVGLTAVGLISLAGTAIGQSGGVYCDPLTGRCQVEAESPESPGSSNSGGASGSDEGTSAGQSDTVAHECYTKVASPQPPAGDSRWGGRDPADGPLMQTFCRDPVEGMTYSPGYSQAGEAAPVVVDLAVLAQQAIEQMTLGAPEIRMSAPPDRGFVGVPVWMWLERGPSTTGPITESATAGAVTVTATARVAQVEWAMGPPGEVVVCRGPGTPWSGQSGPSPDCGYVYQLRSLPERTGGTGRWPIAATNVWLISWSGAGASGSELLRLSSQASLAVGEVQVVVVPPGGGR